MPEGNTQPALGRLACNESSGSQRPRRPLLQSFTPVILACDSLPDNPTGSAAGDRHGTGIPGMATGQPRTAQEENTRALWSWALYDWANSAFFTIILTFIFARYFSQSVVQDDVAGTNAWGNIVGVSGLVVALLAPVLGAIADQSGRRKPGSSPSRCCVCWAVACCVRGAGQWRSVVLCLLGQRGYPGGRVCLHFL